MNAPRARECMTCAVATCEPDADLERAAHLMWTNDCGTLPVVDETQRVVGMVTDRDLLMGAYTRGRSLRDLRVAECMSRTVRSCLPTHTLEESLRALGDAQVRRLPVVDERGVLRGILSLDDVVRHVESMAPSPMRARLGASILQSLAAICQPRRSPAVPEPLPIEPARAPRTARAL